MSNKKKIVVQRTFTYDVEEIKSEWAKMNDGEEPDDEDVWDMVQERAYEDMASPASRHDMTFTDEYGDPLE